MTYDGRNVRPYRREPTGGAVLATFIALHAPQVVGEGEADRPSRWSYCRPNPLGRGVEVIAKIETSWKENFVVDKINKTSRLRRAWGPPTGRPIRHSESDRCVA